MKPEPSPDLNEMIARARNGDVVVLGRLLELYRNYLRVLADLEIGRRLRRKVDASDIVQETYLEAHRQFAQFRGTIEPQLAEWLRTILAGALARTVRRYFGTQARDLRLEQEISSGLGQSSAALSAWAVDSMSTPSHQVVRGEQTMIVTDALSALPDDYRTVLLLRHMEGLTFVQIAEQMNRTVDSVEKLWVRGLARLKQVCEGVLNHDQP